MELKGVGILALIAIGWFVLKPLFVGLLQGIIALFSGKKEEGKNDETKNSN
jgi:hypothetical protein